MNLSMQMAVIVAATCLCLADAAGLASLKSSRPTRGFRPGPKAGLLAARGFGKRDAPTRAEREVLESNALARSTREFRMHEGRLSTARDFGKRMLSRDNREDSSQFSKRRMMEFHPDGDLGTARGFGKRDFSESESRDQQEQLGYEPLPVRREFNPHSKLMVAKDFGKRDGEVYGLNNFWESLESPSEQELQDGQKELEGIPLDWFVTEMLNNPELARHVVRKFIDLNQDGWLSADELLNNTV